MAIRTQTTSVSAHGPGPATGYVNQDQRCVGCGYNLKGLSVLGKCPECGRPIRKRRRGVRGADSLVHAPIGWLLAFRLGATMLMMAVVAAAAAPFASGPLQRAGLEDVIVGAAVAAAAAWWAGTLLTTRARPVMPTTTIDPREEWFWLRLLSRVSQAAWPLAVGAGVAAAKLGAGAGGAPAWLLAVELVLVCAAAGGLVPLSVYLSRICDWASDWTMMMNFRACSMTLTAGAAASVAMAVRGALVAGLITAPAAVSAVIDGPIVLFGGLFVVAATGHLLWCLWRLRGMASWAVVNHLTAEMQAERAKEQAARMRMKR